MVATVPGRPIILGSLVRLSGRHGSFQTRAYDSPGAMASGPVIFYDDLGLVLGARDGFGRAPLVFVVWSHSGGIVSMGWLEWDLLAEVQTALPAC